MKTALPQVIFFIIVFYPSLPSLLFIHVYLGTEREKKSVIKLLAGFVITFTILIISMG